MPFNRNDFSRGKNRAKSKTIDKKEMTHPPGRCYVDETGSFRPSMLPKSGVLVHIESGSPDIPIIVLDNWKITGKIHLMTELVFWSNGFTYTFQVVPSDLADYGKLSLISVLPSESQPGSASRTYKTTNSSIANLK